MFTDGEFAAFIYFLGVQIGCWADADRYGLRPIAMNELVMAKRINVSGSPHRSFFNEQRTWDRS
jgi:hypothetical protein